MKNLLVKAFVAASLLVFAGATFAQAAPALQGTVTLTAVPTSAKGSVAAVLTWSTTPNANGVAASSCTASNGWTGTLATSGTQTEPVTTVTTTYSITCTWNDLTAAMVWVNPTKDSSGATLTDLTGNNVYTATSATGPWTLAKALTPAVTSYLLTGLPVGTNYVEVTAVSASEGEGSASNVGSKVNGPATASTTTVVTVIAVPLGPSTLVIK